jgi:NADH dehydrogenase/NADH:ubiquinone oxidoreductase subunit G
MITLTIDGKTVAAHEDNSILEAAQDNGIFIPTLCHHRAVRAYGGCRLCLVEVKKGGRTRVVASCGYRVEEGASVDTRAPAAVRARNVVMEMLLARCPDSEAVRELAARMGVAGTRFPKQEEDCILCGLCVQVCAEKLGFASISFVGRGSRRRVMVPFERQSADCIGCGACAVVCPTGAVKVSDEGAQRTLPGWHTKLPRVRCRGCGSYFGTIRQCDSVRERTALHLNAFELCPDCRREAAAANLSLYFRSNTVWPGRGK